MRKNAPDAVAVAPRVDRQHGALTSELFGALVENFRIVDGGGLKETLSAPDSLIFLNSSIP